MFGQSHAITFSNRPEVTRHPDFAEKFAIGRCRVTWGQLQFGHKNNATVLFW